MARISVRPYLPQDAAVLDALDLEVDAHLDWRYAGGVPSPQERFHRSWAGVLDRRVFVANMSSGPQVVGYGSLYDYNPRGANAWLAVASTSNVRTSGWGLAASGLYVSQCFREWPLRTIYAQSRGSNLEAFASVLDEGTAEPVGRLATGGPSPSSIHWLAIRRTTWFEKHDTLFANFA